MAESDNDLAVDWGNVSFVVGVSLAVVVAVLFVYPYLKTKFAGAANPQQQES